MTILGYGYMLVTLAFLVAVAYGLAQNKLRDHHRAHRRAAADHHLRGKGA